MAAKKLSWIRKLLIGLGKRIYYRKSEKINLLGLNIMLREVLREYAEYLGGLEGALTEFQTEVKKQAGEVIGKLMAEPIMLGVSMSYALSQSIQDLPFSTHAMIWAVIGKDYKKTFLYPQLELNEDGSGRLYIRIKKCIMCGTHTDIRPEDLGNENYGNIVATLFGTIIKEAWHYIDMQYEVIDAKETKCLLRGDQYGEITITFAPKQ